jgi:hypothetical protein
VETEADVVERDAIALRTSRCTLLNKITDRPVEPSRDIHVMTD